MNINRRSLLKALSLVPVAQFAESALARTLSLTTPAAASTSTYLLLHGMFFMEFYDGLLYVCSPQHNGHQSLKRLHGQPLQPLEKDEDWSVNGIVKPGRASSFPSDILQFPVKLLNPRGLPVLPMANTYAARLILPLPKSIFSYRTDAKQNFKPLSGNIADAISGSTGPRISTITCLEYDPGLSTPFTLSLYAAHDHKPNYTEVNAALKAAQTICGPNFDLSFDPAGCPPTDAPEDQNGSLPPGVDQSDEDELAEIQHNPSHCTVPPGQLGATAVDVASCPQFGIIH